MTVYESSPCRTLLGRNRRLLLNNCATRFCLDAGEQIVRGYAVREKEAENGEDDNEKGRTRKRGPSTT